MFLEQRDGPHLQGEVSGRGAELLSDALADHVWVVCVNVLDDVASVGYLGWALWFATRS